jgi:hypothetical protein
VTVTSIVTTFGTTYDYVTINTGVAAAGLASGGVIKAIVTGLRNPPSINTLTPISVYTADSNGNYEDY